MGFTLPASLHTVSVCAAIPAAMPSILTSTSIVPSAPVLICKPVGTTIESAIASRKRLALSQSRNEKVSVCELVRQRMQAKHGPGDDAEGAERARHQLGQVIAGDVLHHLAAAGGDGAIRQNDGDADDEVANAAVAQAQRPAVIGRDHAADGCALRPQRVQRKPLPVRGERALQLRDGDSGPDGDRHIAGRVLQDAVEARGGNGQDRWRAAQCPNPVLYRLRAEPPATPPGARNPARGSVRPHWRARSTTPALRHRTSSAASPGRRVPSTTIERSASRACCEVGFAMPGMVRRTVPLLRFPAGAEHRGPASPRTTECGERPSPDSTGDRDQRHSGPAASSANPARQTSRT